MFTPPSNVPPAGESEEKWQRELVNSSQTVMLRGLKEGLSYRVRLVARGHLDQPLRLSEELLVTVPGEAVSERLPPPSAPSVVTGRMCSDVIVAKHGFNRHVVVTLCVV